MLRSRKFIIVVVLAATVILVGSLTGVAIVQAGSTDNATPGKTLVARVATILGIDQQKVEDAFAQAQRERQEEALDNYLKSLVDKGTITQEQADQYKQWLQSRPDMAPYKQQLKEWQQARPSIPPELKQWEEAKPNIPLPGPSGRFGARGFRGGPKWGPTDNMTWGEGRFWGG